jgi:hypothetical protein
LGRLALNRRVTHRERISNQVAVKSASRNLAAFGFRPGSRKMPDFRDAGYSNMCSGGTAPSVLFFLHVNKPRGSGLSLRLETPTSRGSPRAVVSRHIVAPHKLKSAPAPTASKEGFRPDAIAWVVLLPPVGCCVDVLINQPWIAGSISRRLRKPMIIHDILLQPTPIAARRPMEKALCLQQPMFGACGETPASGSRKATATEQFGSDRGDGSGHGLAAKEFGI